MNKDTQRLVRWLLVALLIIGSFLFIIFSSSDKSGSNTVPAEDIDLEVSSEEWVKGNAESADVLVEYSDFQCPACASRLPVIEPLMEEFGGHIKFVYRHFPLSMHDNAQGAAQAAEAAGMQGKFWEMHDMIFAGQQSWSNLSVSQADDIFLGYAEELELDIDKFEDDRNSSEVADAVQDDFNSGLAAGVNSTPSFFFNDKKVTIKTGDYDEFRDFLREEIKSDS